MQITPIPKRTLVEIAEERIRDAILGGGFSPGDVLPGEMELAERLGVSRNVVREALSRLRMLGVLKTRKRRGMELTEPDVLHGFAQVVDLPILGEAQRRELAELRLVIEMGLADLVFLRKSPEGLAQLRRVLEREEKAPANSARSIECDIAFHAGLYGMANNATVARFQSLLKPFFGWEAKKAFKPDRFRDPSAVSHRDLFNILETGTAKEFREAMRVHLQPHFERLESVLSR